MTYEQCECEVRQRLSEKRHSQCVAEEAARWPYSAARTRKRPGWQGLLHDILKDTPAEEQLKILQGFGIMMNDTELANRKLWHAISSAAFLEVWAGNPGPGLLSAVRCHTSGRKNMTLLEKGAFVADYISADRDYPGVEERCGPWLGESLEEAIIEGVAFTVQELMSRREPVASASIDAYNDAVAVLKERRNENEFFGIGWACRPAFR